MFGARDHARVRRAQGDLRPGRPDEPRARSSPRRRLDEHLRLGGSWAPHHTGDCTSPTPRTTARSSHAATRCVGVGKCRQHSHERRRGDVPVVPGDAGGGALDARPVTAAVRDAAAVIPTRRSPTAGARPRSRDALDLCLACKGCKSRLPGRRGHGDLQGRVPRSPLRRAAAAALALRDGLAASAGRRASVARMPPASSTRSPTRRCCRRLATRAAGLETARDPAVRRRDGAAVVDAPAAARSRARAATVLLWPDTFTNHFHPHIGRAAVERARGRWLDGPRAGRAACVAG